ncbi:MAG: VIT1/CCC1 transporter family protein [Elusimicrobia bacterium]|nr:VIT1/CCC1 transporter family protein [Elusimicrobiota bacterium]
MDGPELAGLKASHTAAAIAARLAARASRGYLRDLVYGAVDGIVTTFAVVAGVYGAELPPAVVLILGTANLLGDGFSMAIGNFLATRSERELRERARRTELAHIEAVPEGEREEVRQLLARKGFEGSNLERAVAVLTSDRARWVETMLVEELGFPVNDASPWRAGAATFAAFVGAGALPLLPFAGAYGGLPLAPFPWSASLTAAAFFAVGALKARFVARSFVRAGLETAAVGGAAAAAAFAAARLLRGLA